jgi:hypothetical protein
MNDARKENEIAWELHRLGQMLDAKGYKLSHKQMSDRTHTWQQYVIEYGREKKKDDSTNQT